MPYVVFENEPVSLPWSVFIREPYVIKQRFVIPSIPVKRARLVHPTSEHRLFGEFKIHLGRYNIDPVRNQHYIDIRGLPTAATFDGELVGAVNSFNLWVHPAFLKQGLAVEMLVDRFRYTGVGAGRHFAIPGKIMAYTPEGFAALKAGYREIVKRGFINPGPAGVPT